MLTAERFKNLNSHMEESTLELARTLEIRLIQLSGFTTEEANACYFFSSIGYKALKSSIDVINP